MTPMRSYSLSYSVPTGHRPEKGHIASELVGVAGFEPAASSSRTKRAAKLRYTPHTVRLPQGESRRLPAKFSGYAGPALHAAPRRRALLPPGSCA
jgi:hypothetical protein